MKKFLCGLFPAIFIVTTYADDNNAKAVGFTVDLLPTVMSATEKKAGYSLQAWAGYDHVRLRAVSAHMHMNDRLIADKAFNDQTLTVGAIIADYVFGNHFNGFWIGSGYEVWMNRIRHKESGEHVEWTNHVFTAGCGYIVPVTGNFYMEPWGAAHMILNNSKVSAGGDSFAPRRLSAEVSLKAGYFFDL
jgi:hypothetical protein